LPDEIDELIKQVDYLEGRMDVPSSNPYLETVKESLPEEDKEKDIETILNEFNKDLEGLLESIDSYKQTIKKAKENF
jgi:hypothetical protein